MKTITQDEIDALRDVSPPRFDFEERIVDGRRVRVMKQTVRKLYWKEDDDGYVQDRHGVWWSICRDAGEMVKQRSTLSIHRAPG